MPSSSSAGGAGGANNNNGRSINVHQLAQIMKKIKNNPNNPNNQNILQILKRNPQIMAAIIRQRQQNQGNAAAVGGGYGAVTPANGGLISVTAVTGPDRAVGAHINNGSSLNTQQLAQIMQKLKNNPNNPNNQKILQILKQNPRIMAAIIRQRQERETNAAASKGAGVADVTAGNGPQQQQQAMQDQQTLQGDQQVNIIQPQQQPEPHDGMHNHGMHHQSPLLGVPQDIGLGVVVGVGVDSAAGQSSDVADQLTKLFERL